MNSPKHLVETLAQALDNDDYPTATSVMADRVEYTIGDQTLNGPDSVVASYRAASAVANRLFDRVEYGHRVMTTNDPTTFKIEYWDKLTSAGETLTHAAEQHVTAVAGEGVVRIINVDVPGEREKVDEFLDRHGLSRER